MTGKGGDYRIIVLDDRSIDRDPEEPSPPLALTAVPSGACSLSLESSRVFLPGPGHAGGAVWVPSVPMPPAAPPSAKNFFWMALWVQEHTPAQAGGKSEFHFLTKDVL